MTRFARDLASPTARVKYRAAKRLRLLSEQHPALLYPQFAFFAGLMDGDNRILAWNSTRILGNLAQVDGNEKLEKMLDHYLAPITGKELIRAANVIQGAAAIAAAKPHLADRVARGILKVSRANYATPECRNVAIGHALTAFDRFFEHVRRKKVILAFAVEQTTNPRPAVRKKAEKFLRKWAVESKSYTSRFRTRTTSRP